MPSVGFLYNGAGLALLEWPGMGYAVSGCMETIEKLLSETHSKLGSQLNKDDQRHALSAFVHRFTGDHKPLWASGEWKDGKGYPVQFRDDSDWLAHTRFVVRRDGKLNRSIGECHAEARQPHQHLTPSMKTILHLAPINGGLARSVELEDERILCNDVVLPHERHPHGMKLWVIGNQFGAMGAVWANHEQDALDELVDADLAGGILIDGEDADEETTRLGNAGEPCDLTYAWIQPVVLEPARDWQLLCRFAEARGAGQNTLDR